MRIEHLKKNGGKVEISVSDFYSNFISLGRAGNYGLCIKCNWANDYNELTNFKINITNKNYDERYIVTNPLFYLIFNLIEFFGISNTDFELKGEVCQKFKNSIYDMIKRLNDSVTGFDIRNDNFISYKLNAYELEEKKMYFFYKIVNSFFNYDMQLKNDIIKKLKEFSRKLHEITNLITLIEKTYYLSEEIFFKKNIKDRDNEKINSLINEVDFWVNYFSKYMVH